MNKSQVLMTGIVGTGGKQGSRAYDSFISLILTKGKTINIFACNIFHRVRLFKIKLGQGVTRKDFVTMVIPTILEIKLRTNEQYQQKNVFS